LYAVYDDRDLAAGMAPIAVSDPLMGILDTLSEPSIGLSAISTDDMDNPPEVLIVHPRLVLP
jgi:hypothetical protein